MKTKFALGANFHTILLRRVLRRGEAKGFHNRPYPSFEGVQVHIFMTQRAHYYIEYEYLHLAFTLTPVDT